MSDNPDRGAAALRSAAQALRSEVQTSLATARRSISKAVEEARAAQRTSLASSLEAFAKTQEELARIMASPPAPADAAPQNVLSEQMKMTSSSIQAAQQGIERALAATASAVGEAMKQARG